MQFPMVPPPPQPDSVSRYAPVFGANRTLQRETPVVGTRYCQHLHAYVPENLAYCVSGLGVAQPTKVGRLFSRKRKTPTAGKENGPVRGGVRGVGKASGSAPKIRVVREATVLAEGLTHHQAALVSLRDAQNDVRIRYRALTKPREDLMPIVYAQLNEEIKHRAVLGDLAPR